MNETIAILLHRDTAAARWRSYFIFQLAQCWRDCGYRMAFIDDQSESVPADLLFVHVDLSVVPMLYRAVVPRYPRAVNGQVFDIRKRAISRNLVGPDSDWDGPVVVKTDLNSRTIHGKLLSVGRSWVSRGLLERQACC